MKPYAQTLAHGKDSTSGHRNEIPKGSLNFFVEIKSGVEIRFMSPFFM